ncbi:MAG: serine/threonine-protein kinase [Sandaracinaceae bacterium]
MRPAATLEDDEAAAWAANRIGLWSGLLAAEMVAGWVLALVRVAARQSSGLPGALEIGDHLHLAVGALLAGAGAAASRARSDRSVKIADVTLVYLAGLLSSVLVIDAETLHQGAVLLILDLTVVLFIRAALVPTRPARTGLYGGTMWLAATLLAGFLWEVLRGPVDTHERPVLLVMMTFWGAFTVLITVILTQSIYGLRKQVASHERMGQYILERRIAAGGMGVLYRARHALLRRPAALKLLRPELSDEANVSRFEREVRLTSLLRHPNTVEIFDYGVTADGVFFYAMELLDGADVDALVRRCAPLPLGRVIYLLRQIADALTEAHGAGLIHRDIKPSNLFVSRAGPVTDWMKVLDFGLVRAVSADRPTDPDEPIVGTPAFIAPEQVLRSGQIDGRAALYALGGVAYFMLTGAPPFRGTTPELLDHHVSSPPEAPSTHRADVPPALDDLVLRLLAKRPEARPADARAVVEVLDVLQEAFPWHRRDRDAAWAERPLSSVEVPVAGPTRLTIQTRATSPSAHPADDGARRDVG